MGAAHLATKKRFILGDPTGTGKTPQCLYAWAMIRDQRLQEGQPPERLWVVTTKSASLQWAKEVQKFLTGVNVHLVRSENERGTPIVRKKRLEVVSNFISDPGSVLIQSWNQFVSDTPEFLKKGESTWLKETQICLDEAQRIKNPKSATAKRAKMVLAKVDRAHGLTATLVKNQAHDAQSIIDVFSPKLCSKKVFESLHCVYEKRHSMFAHFGGKRRYFPNGTQVRELVGYKDLADFRTRILPVFLDRTDEELDIQRPEIVQVERFCQMTSRQRNFYDEFEAGILEQSVDEEALVRVQQAVNTPELWDVPHNAKLDLLLELLGNELNGEPVILYSPLISTIDCYDGALQEYSPVRITGRESDSEREEARVSFQDGKTNVIMLTNAGGESLNLQRAKHVVFLSRPWDPGTYVQLVGRARRFGSEHKTLTVWHLSCLDSLDEYVDATLIEKFGPVEEIARGRSGILSDSVVSPLDIVKVARRMRIRRTRQAYCD